MFVILVYDVKEERVQKLLPKIDINKPSHKDFIF
jgi:hypothetical protein